MTAAGDPRTLSRVNEPLIDIREVTKDYRGKRALNMVDVRVAEGVTGLLGPNGAGKSTLIKALLGLVRVQAGSGTVLGHDFRRASREIRASIGYMPEDDGYIADLAGVEVVRFLARLSGLPSVEGLRRAHEILDFCAMGQERYRPIQTYSTGMRQKLKFAQSIVHDPRFLILDEPTSGLDPRERRALLERIRTLATRFGKGVLVSTHILPDVQEICDAVVILDRGRVRVSESLAVLSRPVEPTLEVRVHGDRRVFKEHLDRRGITVEDGLRGLLKVHPRERRVNDDPNGAAEAEEALRGELWEVARESGVGIRGMNPGQNSLEQIFLEAVQGTPHAHS